MTVVDQSGEELLRETLAQVAAVELLGRYHRGDPATRHDWFVEGFATYLATRAEELEGGAGALGGQALRPRETRYKNWQVLGALAAVYGLLIGFGPGRDNTAHLGGMLAGLLLGRINPPLPEPTPRVVSPEAPRPRP